MISRWGWKRQFSSFFPLINRIFGCYHSLRSEAEDIILKSTLFWEIQSLAELWLYDLGWLDFMEYQPLLVILRQTLYFIHTLSINDLLLSIL